MRLGSWVETKSGDAGYVIDYQYADPVVYFPSNGQFRRMAKSDCFDKTVNVIGVCGAPKRIAKRRKTADTFKMPLSYGVLIGFQPLTSGFYQFRQKFAGKKYPWDNGSIWKVSDSSDGHKYLVKEEETGNTTTFSHPYDNDGTPTSAPSSTDATFDGGPIPGKSYGSYHLEDLRKVSGIDFEEDWMGNLTIYRGGEVLAFMQEADAERFKADLSDVKASWEKRSSLGSVVKPYDLVLSEFLSNTFVLA